MSTVTLPRHQKEIDDAERLLFTGRQQLGLAKGLFFGRFVADWVMPYPSLAESQRHELETSLQELRAFLDETLDPILIDRHADIPPEVITGLGRLGILGMTAPPEYGGRGFSQMAYARMLEEIGTRCASTSVFVNAHHSVGIRALLLFGTEEQKRQWLPAQVSGRQLAAFALTETEAGSDAANVQTRAEPSADGSHYILNGEKRYITNAAIAQVLTVMARTPVPGHNETAVTAFLITPDMPGFAMIEPRMEKLGIRGTATGRLAFRDMPVPRENILGPLGKGLKVALSVLDFGRTTFGACSTGAAKTCLRLATHHASQRRQFGRTLGEFELVKAKLARMAAHIYAMEAVTTVTASLIDRGLEDYMLETAMLKVFTTEALWQIVNDTFQIYGGSAYFTDLPLERMLRDARINQIGEGANEVLLSFIALVGMRGPSLQLKEIWDALHHPSGHLRAAWAAGMDRVGAALHAPDIPFRNDTLQPFAQRLSRLIWYFNIAVDRTLIQHREEILDRQLLQERIATAAIELFASACVLSRWDSDLQVGLHEHVSAAALFLHESSRRTGRALAELRENDDDAVIAAADAALQNTA